MRKYGSPTKRIIVPKTGLKQTFEKNYFEKMNKVGDKVYCEFVISNGDNTVILPYLPILPQTFNMYIDGKLGYMCDLSTDKEGLVYLTNINGHVGDACLNRETGELILSIKISLTSKARVNYCLES